MILTNSEQQAIRDSLAEWLNDPHLPDLAGLARNLEALPVYADMGAALLIRPDGTVISASTDQPWDETATASLETRSEWVQVAHLEAARRHAALTFLQPRRPIDAEDCNPCSGTGSLDISGNRFRCGECYGLGWRRTS